MAASQRLLGLLAWPLSGAWAARMQSQLDSYGAEAGRAGSCYVTGYIFDLPGEASEPREQEQDDLPSHLVFETPVQSKVALRALVQNVSAASFRRPRVTFVAYNPGPGIETSADGVPTIRSMFEAAFSQLPEADTYTYFNSDIAVDESFVATADAVAKAVKRKVLRDRFLVVGRRTNVNWDAKYTSVTDADFKDKFQQGKLFMATAEDYFMVSQKSFNWSAVPAFIPGRIGYDNWLVQAANTDASIDAVDATQTLQAIHMTDPAKGNQEGFHKGNNMYNMDLVPRGVLGDLLTHGRVTSTHWKTCIGSNGEVEVVARTAASCAS